MDNFGVIASLMLFGLFLISSPSEGYVVGYIDFSDQRLQSSLLTRQDEPGMNNKRREPEVDGDVIYASEDRDEGLPVDKQIFPNNEFDGRHDISYNPVAAENQNGVTSQNADNNMFISDDRKGDGEIMKKGDNMLADAPTTTKNENDNDLTGPNTILYVQVTSSKL